MLEATAQGSLAGTVSRRNAAMSTVITIGAVILILAFFAMFLWSPWRLRTIGILLAGVAIAYAGTVVWLSDALARAIDRRNASPHVDSVPHKVGESDYFQVATNGAGAMKSNAP